MPANFAPVLTANSSTTVPTRLVLYDLASSVLGVVV